MNPLKLKYKLNKSEIEEALLCLNYRREGRYRNINLAVTSVLGILVLIAYMQNPGQFFLFLLLLLIILFIFYLAYGPRAGRKKRAEKIARMGGEYRLELSDTYIIYGETGEKLKLSDGKILFINSDHVYVIKIYRDVFTIPKRILSAEEHREILRVMNRENVNRINIVIERT